MSPAEQIQREIHRALSGPQHLQIAAAMSEAVRELFLARLRQAHPEWAPRKLVHEWVRVVHGIDLGERVPLRL